MKKIVLCCFWNRESNCGDKAYIEVFRTLVKSRNSEISVDICDFYAREPVESVALSDSALHNSPVSNATSNLNNAESGSSFVLKCKKLVKSLFSDRLLKKYRKCKKYQLIQHYYEKKLSEADAVIIPGGGLVEYSSWRDYYRLIEMLQKICNRNCIPMYINSVGYVANEAPGFWIHRWERIINNKCVAYFSCRDNLALFQQLNPRAKQIPCLACLGGEVFNKKKNSGSNTIGIGLMRYDAYSDYGNDITKEFLLRYYAELIDALLKKGYKIRLFSVGVSRNQEFGKSLKRYINNDEVILCDRPLEYQQMLEQISEFKGILTVRTHSAYTAFSLDIPAVMIYFGTGGWEGKSTEFMKMMGTPDNAVCCDELSPSDLAERFEIAINNGWNHEIMQKRKEECRTNFEEIMNKIGC